MTASSSHYRPLLIGAIALALLSVGGCAWTRDKLGMDAKYQDSVQNQPLEVPPGLDLPATTGAITVPDVTGNPNVRGTPAVAALPGGISSFTMADTLDSAWRRVGIALGKIEGVSVDGTAKLLNSYEVSYQGTAMLIRVETVGNESRVVALGSDGKELSGGPGGQLLALLKARLG
ncbi:hypothetical protein [Arenimonas sp. MALMAid1274]|uniref:hypothetical protein n=1 Tax=Arenimonas sp. MALMAid1274 TaxID=3411630 RepID=UPI003BA0333A